MFQIWSWYEKNWGSCEILFRASYHKQPPGAIKTPLNFFDALFCHKCLTFSVNITAITKRPPNMESRESDLSGDMYFVKIIKSFDSKRP